jgi:FHS family glucose/mannose:H+ symporter-like MFS transporter
MSNPEPTSVRLLSASACAGLFVFGIVMALLGAILPSLANRLQFAVADIGTLFLVMNFAMLLCSLALGLAIDRFGMKPPLTLGPLLVALALALIVRAQDVSGLYPAVALLGIGGGAVNGAANTLVADLHDDPKRKSGALNLLGVFFGFGALFLPFTIGALLARFSLSTLLVACSVLCAAAGVFSMILRFPPPKQAHRLPVGDMPRFLRSPLVLVFACLLFFESGVEFTLGGFISSYLTHDMVVSSVSTASWILAGYWLSLILSRTALSRIALGTDPFRILSFCALGACVGAVVTAVAPVSGAAAVGIWLTGWSLAGIYPSVLGIVGAKFQAHSGTVFGILFAIALTGGMFIPWVSGQIGGNFGLRWVFGLIACSFAVVLILTRIGAKLSRVA